MQTYLIKSKKHMYFAIHSSLSDELVLFFIENQVTKHTLLPPSQNHNTRKNSKNSHLVRHWTQAIVSKYLRKDS